MLVVAKKSTAEASGEGMSGQIVSNLPAPIKSVIIPMEKDAITVPNKFPLPFY